MKQNDMDDFNLIAWMSVSFSMLMLMLIIMLLILYEYEKKQEAYYGVVQSPATTEQVPSPTIQPVQINSSDGFITAEDIIVPSGIIQVPVEPAILSGYKVLYDKVGYVYLHDGNVYPVMQRVPDQNCYQYRNFHEGDDKDGK